MTAPLFRRMLAAWLVAKGSSHTRVFMDSDITQVVCSSRSDAVLALEGLLDSAPRKLLSIVMPVRNEDENMRRAYDEITAAMAAVACDYEVLVIDNCSTDETRERAAEICASDERWRYVRLSRNFGLEASLAAGFHLARGDAAIVVFGDLQDPPALIPQFVEKWTAGYDVVYGVIRRRTGDPFWRAFLARGFYRAANYLADSDVPQCATDFRLLSRRAIDAVNQFDERNRYIRGYSHWIGLNQCPIVYDRRPRTAGKSKAPFGFLLNYAVNAITCFSIRPLQLFSLFGFLTLVATVALAAYFFARYCLGYAIHGSTTMLLLLLVNQGLILLGFGVVGEYIGRIYLETKRRPLYIVEQSINMPPRDSAASDSYGPPPGVELDSLARKTPAA